MPGKRLLIIHQGALGDVVTVFPALFLLKRKYRRIDLACRDSIGRTARLLGAVDGNFGLESAFFASMYAEKAPGTDSGLRAFFSDYDAIVLFSFSDELRANVRESSGRPTHLIAPRPLPGVKKWVPDHLIQALLSEGLIEERANGDLAGFLCERRDPDRDERKVFIQPGSGSRLKNWPLEHFLILEKSLKNEGLRPVFVLGPAEKEMGRAFGGGTLQGLSLEELTGVLKTGGGYIGNDSGVSHLAAFTGLPTLVVFGPTDPARWRPAGRLVETVAPDFSCDPCFETEKGRCETLDCLARISPFQVLEAFKKLWSRHG